MERVCRNIGNRNRTILGNRTRWIPVPTTRLTLLPLLEPQQPSVTRNHIAKSHSLWMSSFALNIELVTGKQRDSKLELLLREGITMRQGIVCNSQHRLSEVMWIRSIKALMARMMTSLELVRLI